MLSILTNLGRSNGAISEFFEPALLITYHAREAWICVSQNGLTYSAPLRASNHAKRLQHVFGNHCDRHVLVVDLRDCYGARSRATEKSFATDKSRMLRRIQNFLGSFIFAWAKN